MLIKLDKNEYIISRLLSSSLFGNEETVSCRDINLKELFKISIEQAICAVLFDGLPQGVSEFDKETYELWKNYSLAVVCTNEYNCRSSVELASLLKENGLDYCIIKGCTSAKYYPKSYLRQMGDVDCLIENDKLAEVRNILLSNGYVCQEATHDFHETFKKDKMVFEVHSSLTKLPKGKEYLLKHIEDAVYQTEELQLEYGSVMGSNALYHGIIMLLHMQRHLTDGTGVGLRHLIDWAVFANSFDNETWISGFKQKILELKLWEFARIITKSAQLYLGLPSKDWFEGVDASVAELLVYDILKGGNFGCKDAENMYQQQVFSNVEYVKDNMVVRFFRSSFDRMYSWKPIFKKYKVLAPIGFLIYSTRVMFQICTGKKKLEFVEIYKQGKLRHNLLKELHFFDDEII